MSIDFSKYNSNNHPGAQVLSAIRTGHVERTGSTVSDKGIQALVDYCEKYNESLPKGYEQYGTQKPAVQEEPAGSSFLDKLKSGISNIAGSLKGDDAGEKERYGLAAGEYNPTFNLHSLTTPHVSKTDNTNESVGTTLTDAIMQKYGQTNVEKAAAQQTTVNNGLSQQDASLAGYDAFNGMGASKIDLREYQDASAGFKNTAMAYNAEASYADKAKNTYEFNKLNVNYAYEAYKYMNGQENDMAGAKAIVEEYAQMHPEIFNQDDEGLLGQMGLASAEMAPFMVETMKGGAEMGMAGAIGAGGAAALLGQAGPQIATPEEIVTVPTAAAVGFKMGSTMGSAMASYQLEAGFAYADMIEQGINPDIASQVATFVGLANAGIEVAQVGTIAKKLPFVGKALSAGLSEGAEEVAQKYIRNASGKTIMKGLKEFGKDVLSETGEEVAQETVNIIGETVAQKKMGNKDYTPFTADNGKRLIETATQTLKAMPLITAPGNVIQTGSTLKQDYQIKKTEGEITKRVSEVLAVNSMLPGEIETAVNDVFLDELHNIAGSSDVQNIIDVAKEGIDKVRLAQLTSYGRQIHEAVTFDDVSQVTDNIIEIQEAAQEIIDDFKKEDKAEKYGSEIALYEGIVKSLDDLVVEGKKVESSPEIEAAMANSEKKRKQEALDLSQEANSIIEEANQAEEAEKKAAEGWINTKTYGDIMVVDDTDPSKVKVKTSEGAELEIGRKLFEKMTGKKVEDAKPGAAAETQKVETDALNQEQERELEVLRSNREDYMREVLRAGFANDKEAVDKAQAEIDKIDKRIAELEGKEEKETEKKESTESEKTEKAEEKKETNEQEDIKETPKAEKLYPVGTMLVNKKKPHLKYTVKGYEDGRILLTNGEWETEASVDRLQDAYDIVEEETQTTEATELNTKFGRAGNAAFKKWSANEYINADVDNLESEYTQKWIKLFNKYYDRGLSGEGIYTTFEQGELELDFPPFILDEIYKAGVKDRESKLKREAKKKEKSISDKLEEAANNEYLDVKKIEIPAEFKGKKEVVYRRANEEVMPEDKPHGLYVTPALTEDYIYTHHYEEGDKDFFYELQPGKVLEVESTRVKHSRFDGGSGYTSTGVEAINKLESENFEELLKLNKADLTKRIEERFPGVEGLDKYYDAWELLEVYGAQLAREKGFDTIIGIDSKTPSLSEYVVLKNDVIVKDDNLNTDSESGIIEPKKGTHRYYLTQRPPSLGTHPKGTTNIVSFDERQYVDEIGREAWGYVEYDKELSAKEIDDYELMESEGNVDEHTETDRNTLDQGTNGTGGRLGNGRSGTDGDNGNRSADGRSSGIPENTDQQTSGDDALQQTGHGNDGLRSDTDGSNQEGTGSDDRGRKSDGDSDSVLGLPDREGQGVDGDTTGSDEVSKELEETATGANYSIGSKEDLFNQSGKKTRYKANVKALKLLTKLIKEKRTATIEEQKVLALYTGWGAIQDVFDERESGWSKERNELVKVTDELEDLIGENNGRSNSIYYKMRSTIGTAFYTPYEVIESMYNALDHMGYKKGALLEPSMGTGNFFGSIPGEMAKNTRLYGVEIDRVTGEIAKQLYQNSDIRIQGFEKVNYLDDYFNVVIGNVPFANAIVTDDKYPTWAKQGLHNYFIAKSIDKVKPGGVLMCITSTGTMDSESGVRFRDAMSAKAELLGAIRLPSSTFKNAGTSVTSDLLIFRKLKENEVGENKWSNIKDKKVSKGNVRINEYFVDHPEHVLGKLEVGYRGAVVTNKDKNYSEKLTPMLKEMLPKDILKYSQVSTAKPINESAAQVDTQDISTGIVYEEDGKVYRKLSAGKSEEITKNVEQVKKAVKMKNLVRTLIEAERDPNANIEEMEQARRELKSTYDNYVKKHGQLLKRRKVKNKFGNETAIDRLLKYKAKSLNSNNMKYVAEPESYLLRSLEIETVSYDNKGNAVQTIKPSMILTQRVYEPIEQITKVDTAEDGLIASLNNLGYFDIQHVVDLYGKSEEEIIEELGEKIYSNPIGGWETSDEYLSGNVKEKLKKAKEFAKVDEKYKRNVEALEKVQPEDIPFDKITVRTGDFWMPKEINRKIIADVMGISDLSSLSLNYDIVSSEWTLGTRYAYNPTPEMRAMSEGLGKFGAVDIVVAALNNKSLEVTHRDSDGKSYTDVEKTNLITARINEVRTRAKDYLFENPEDLQLVERVYNEKLNNTVPRNFEEIAKYFKFPSMSKDITLQPHQKVAVVRALLGGNTLLAHTVGAGKTFEEIAIAIESKRLGLANKPVIVVPNNKVVDFENDAKKLYPGAKILALSNVDFNSYNRRKTLAIAATNDWDAVIVRHKDFGDIPTSPGLLRAEIEKQLADYEHTLTELEKSNGDRHSMNNIVAEIKKLKEKLDKVDLQANQNKGLFNFEEIGFDYIVVDEAHEFKNYALPGRAANIKGISSTGANKTLDMMIKTNYVSKLHNYKRGVTFATGTPITNSMSDIYVMFKYLRNDLMENVGIRGIDTWADAFADIDFDIELKATGDFSPIKMFKAFTNLPELVNLFQVFADIKMKDDLNLPLPKADFVTVECDPHPKLGEIMARLKSEYASGARDGMLFRAYNKIKQAPQDMRFVERDAINHSGSKIHKMTDAIVENYNLENDNKGTQLVFLRIGESKATGFNLWDEVRKVLIEKGIPENEVAVMDKNTTQTQSDDYVAKINKGEIRVLIGSYGKLGVGMNVQKRLYAIHEFDVPFRPIDLEQCEGRIIRRGNMYKDLDKSVKVFRYVTVGTEDSFSSDAYSWGLVEGKLKGINAFLKADPDIRTMEGVDEEVNTLTTLKAKALGDDRFIAKVALEKDTSALNGMYNSFKTNKARSANRISDEEYTITRREQESAVFESVKKALDRDDNIAYVRTDNGLKAFKLDDKKENKSFYEEVSKVWSSMKKDAEERKEMSRALFTYKGLTISYNLENYGLSGGMIESVTASSSSAEGRYILDKTLVGEKNKLRFIEMKKFDFEKRFKNALDSLPNEIKRAKDDIEYSKENIGKYKKQQNAEFKDENKLFLMKLQIKTLNDVLGLSGIEHPGDPEYMKTYNDIVNFIFSNGDESKVDVYEEAYNEMLELNKSIKKEQGGDRVKPLLSRINDIKERVVSGEGFNGKEGGSSSKDEAAISFNKIQSNTFQNVINTNKSIDEVKADKATYEKARNGNLNAAVRLVDNNIDKDSVKQLAIKHPHAYIAPVIDADNIDNSIPVAFSNAVSKHSGLELDLNIIKENSHKDSKMSAIERMADKPTFTGLVVPGREYIITDDVFTMGSTINELKVFIENNGGIVVDVATLSQSKNGNNLNVTEGTKSLLDEKFNIAELEEILKEGGVINDSIEELTEGEARQLQKLKNLDSIRTKISKRQVGEGFGDSQEVNQKRTEKSQEVINYGYHGKSMFHDVIEGLAANNKKKEIKGFNEMISKLSSHFKLPVDTRGFRKRKAAGYYEVVPRTVRIKYDNDIEVVMHEIGHHLDSKYKLSKNNPVAVKEMVDNLPIEFTENYADNKLPGEAVAEFFKMYVVDPKAAREFGSAFYDIFEDTLNKKDLVAVQNTQEDMREFTSAGLDDMFGSTVKSYADKSDLRSFSDKRKYAEMKLQAFLFENNLGLLNLAKYVENEEKKELNASKNPYILALHTNRSQAIAAGMIGGVKSGNATGMIDPHSNLIDERNLADLMAPIVENEKEFSIYLKNKHAQDLMGMGHRVYSPQFTIDMVNDQVEKAELAHPEFKETAEELYGWWDKFMEAWMVDTGFISQESWAEMKELYPHYVPMLRVNQEYTVDPNGNMIQTKSKKGIGSQTAPIHRLSQSGSGLDTYDPLESMVLQMFKIVDAQMKREVMLSMHDLYSKNIKGIGEFYHKINRPMEYHSYDARELKNSMAIGFLNDFFSQNYKLELSDKQLSALLFGADRTKENLENQLMAEGVDLEKLDEVLAGIKEHLLENANNPANMSDIISEFLDSEYTPIDIMERYIDNTIEWFTPSKYSKDNEVMTVIDRSNNVHFYKINDRFLHEALAGFAPMQLDGFFRAWVQSKRIFTNLITSGNPVFGVLSNLPRDIQTGFIQGHENNPVKYAKELGESFKSVMLHEEANQMYRILGGGFGSSVSGTQRNMMKEVRNKLGFEKSNAGSRAMMKLEKFNDAIESAPRQVEFFNVYNEEIENGAEHHDAVLKALYESSDVTLNFMKRGQIMNLPIAQVIPFFNAGLQGLDKLGRMATNKETRKAALMKAIVTLTIPTLIQAWRYRDDDDYKKISKGIRDNYWLIKYADGKFVRIAKPRELAFIFSTLEDRMIRWFSGEEDAFDKLDESFMNVFVPPLEPVIATQLIQVARNKSWTGAPIVPYNLQGRSVDYQYDDKTSWIAIQAAKLMPDILGAYSSPKNIDYLIDQLTGIVGDVVLSLTTPSEDPIQKVFSSRVTADVAYSNDAVNDFYAIKEKLDDASAVYKAERIKTDDYNAAAQTYVNGMYKKINKYWDLIKRVEKSKNYTDTEREKKIREYRLKIVQYAQKGVDYYNKR